MVVDVDTSFSLLLPVLVNITWSQAQICWKMSDLLKNVTFYHLRMPSSIQKSSLNLLMIETRHWTIDWYEYPLIAGTSNLSSSDSKIEFSHWLCGPGNPVTSIRLSNKAQLVAVGLGSGEVHLYRLWLIPSTEPLRTISLKEWGFDSEVTGSVSDLRWTPDSRALAVSCFWLRCLLTLRNQNLLGACAPATQL